MDCREVRVGCAKQYSERRMMYAASGGFLNQSSGLKAAYLSGRWPPESDSEWHQDLTHVLHQSVATAVTPARRQSLVIALWLGHEWWKAHHVS
jgi:hypothetical protein